MKAKITNKTKDRSGFTLVELLMVIIIIALLGTMSITVSRMAVESAKRSRTEITIAKLDSVITSMYEKYQYRKVDVGPYLQLNPWGGVLRPNELKARWRLHILRDIIRMDMPCCLAEVFGPVRPENSSNMEDDNKREITPLCNLYRRAMVLGGYLKNDYSIKTDGTPRNNILNAELLYLVVSNGDPNARSMFSDREIGDVNNNGLFEFLDGWGNPIQWARWAPKFNVRENEFIFGTTDRQGNGLDPLDPMNLDGGLMLIPVIYSCGPDGESGYVSGVYDESRLGSSSDYFSVLWDSVVNLFDPGSDTPLKSGNTTCSFWVPEETWLESLSPRPDKISPLSLDNIHNQSVVK